MIKVTVTNNGDTDISVGHKTIPTITEPAPVFETVHVGGSISFDADKNIVIRIEELK